MSSLFTVMRSLEDSIFCSTVTRSSKHLSNRMSADLFWRDFLAGLKEAARVATQKYLPTIQKFAPELIEEMQSMASSLADFETILALNCRTELMSRKHSEAVSECTTVCLPQHSLLSQNWDWVMSQQPACFVADVKAPHKLRFVTLTEAGILSKQGINEKGLAVTLNLLKSRLDFTKGDGGGFPIHLALRKVLSEAQTTAEAVALIKSLPFDASSCFTFCDAAGDAVALEISPAGVWELRHEADLLVHTNHFVVPEALAASKQVEKSPTNSTARFNLARTLAAAATPLAEPFPDWFRRILQDHNKETFRNGLCRHSEGHGGADPDVFGTISCLVFNCKDSEIFVGGVPCSQEWKWIHLSLSK